MRAPSIVTSTVSLPSAYKRDTTGRHTVYAAQSQRASGKYGPMQETCQVGLARAAPQQDRPWPPARAHGNAGIAYASRAPPSGTRGGARVGGARNAACHAPD